MIESRTGRVAALGVLFVALFGLLVWYGTLAPDPATANYPGDDRVNDDPGRYVGDRVAVSGRVVGTDPVEIEVTDGTGPPVTFRVRGVDHPVEEGQRLRLYGRLEDRETIAAIHSFAVPQRNLAYAYVVSFLAGLWTLSRVVRTWRLDVETLALLPRSRPLSLRSPWTDDPEGESTPTGGGDGA